MGHVCPLWYGMRVERRQPGATKYRLSLFDLETKKGWSKDLEVPGNAKLEHFDSHTVQVSGQRYDAATGTKQ